MRRSLQHSPCTLPLLLLNPCISQRRSSNSQLTQWNQEQTLLCPRDKQYTTLKRYPVQTDPQHKKSNSSHQSFHCICL